jgi:hypothetical protein
MATVPARRAARGLVVLLAVVGLVALVAGVFYFVTPARSVPTWLPGHIAGSTIHHVRRATAAIVVAVLCAVGVWFLTARQRSTSVRQ